jgi:hypothetical protein
MRSAMAAAASAEATRSEPGTVGTPCRAANWRAATLLPIARI